MKFSLPIVLFTLGSLSNLPDSTQSFHKRQVIPWPYSKSSGKSFNSNDEGISEQIINIKPEGQASRKTNYMVVTNPKTGQKFRRPRPPSGSNSFTDIDTEGASSVEQSMIYRGPPMQATASQNAARLPQGSVNRPSGYDKSGQDAQPDDYFDYDQYQHLPQTGLPPLIQEHLVTSHVRPIWSSQHRNYNPRPKQNTNNPSSVINIFIITPNEKSDGGKPSLHIDVSSNDGQHKSVSIQDKIQQGPIRIPIIPSKSNDGSSQVAELPSLPATDPSSSGIGLIDPKK